MEFKVGDRVKIVSKKPEHCYWDNGMNKWLGKIMTIRTDREAMYRMEEDKGEYFGHGWYWDEEFIECKVYNNEIHVTVKGAETIAVLKTDGKVVNRATSICNQQDVFDFEVGAKLAFERLFKNEDKKSVKEVKRRAKVGEYIKIVDATLTDNAYENGDIFKVAFTRTRTPLLLGGIRVEEHDILIWAHEYVVLEGYEPPKEEPKYYNAKVVCVKAFEGCTTVGKIYEIKDGKMKFDGQELCEVVHNDLAHLNNNCSSKFIEVVE